MIQIAHGWELEVERGPDWLFIRPHCGPGPHDDTPEFAEEVWHLIEQNFTHRLVLELDQVEYLNSYFIGQLARLHKRIARMGGLLRICGLSPLNQSILDQCRLTGHFACYDNRTDAVMGHQPRQPR